MRKILAISIFLFAFFTGSQIIYAEVKIDKTALANGIVTVTYPDKIVNKLKITVEKDGNKYAYDIVNNDPINLPLQMGTGEYVIRILENIGGNKYRPIKAETLQVDKIDEQLMYSNSIQLVNFNNDMAVIKKFIEMLKEANGNKKKTEKAYEYVTREISYDFDKAANPPSGYIPDIEEIDIIKKGICYDYASLLGGALRSNGIPTKLIMGYSTYTEVYHAWNEIYIDGKWIIVDTTVDSQYIKAKQKIDMVKKSKDYKTVKIY